MGTVLRVDGFSIVIRTRDHEPPHVHVLCSGDDEEAVIDLAPVGVRDVWGMKAKHVVRAVEIVEDELDYLIECWREIHDCE
ncbi:MAG TPA: DUF4160 domain-containing protein [Longimicrobiaceae bacterium]